MKLLMLVIYVVKLTLLMFQKYLQSNQPHSSYLLASIHVVNNLTFEYLEAALLTRPLPQSTCIPWVSPTDLYKMD